MVNTEQTQEIAAAKAGMDVRRRASTCELGACRAK